MEKQKIKFSQRGFTLVELLVVIAIIGILATIVIVNVNAAREKAKIAAVKTEARSIYNAIMMLEADTGEGPGHEMSYEVNEPGDPDNEICEDGCDFKFSDPQAGLTATDGLYTEWKGPYLSEGHLLDPWGNEYFFDTDYDLDPDPGDQGQYGVVIGSYGPNGTGLNDYDSDDIFYIIKQ